MNDEEREELEQLRVRVTLLKAKITRQAEIITKLEESRKAMLAFIESLNE